MTETGYKRYCIRFVPFCQFEWGGLLNDPDPDHVSQLTDVLNDGGVHLGAQIHHGIGQIALGLVAQISDEYMKPRPDRSIPRLMSRCMESFAKPVTRKRQFR